MNFTTCSAKKFLCGKKSTCTTICLAYVVPWQLQELFHPGRLFPGPQGQIVAIDNEQSLSQGEVLHPEGQEARVHACNGMPMSVFVSPCMQCNGERFPSRIPLISHAICQI